MRIALRVNGFICVRVLYVFGSTRPNKTCTASDPSTLDSHFIVEDCHLTNIPVEYKAATALFGGYVSSSVIRNNLIANTSYSGLTLGWGWGREAGGGGNNSLCEPRHSVLYNKKRRSVYS